MSDPKPPQRLNTFLQAQTSVGTNSLLKYCFWLDSKPNQRGQELSQTQHQAFQVYFPWKWPAPLLSHLITLRGINVTFRRAPVLIPDIICLSCCPVADVSGLSNHSWTSQLEPYGNRAQPISECLGPMWLSVLQNYSYILFFTKRCTVTTAPSVCVTYITWPLQFSHAIDF